MQIVCICYDALMTMKAAGTKGKTLRDTPIRRKVMAVFDGATEPLAAKAVAAKIPGADTVTVYRTIEALLDAGSIVRVDLGGRAALYESLGKSHHHHIVCTSCGAIEGFDRCGLDELARETVARSKAFASVTRHSFELFGICKPCSKK